ncbi:MAG: hypothetical protein HKL90_07650 [Elusimicrobia bacterium]|nr:hypothetical protein [Elusimicrobiota bacterium]
MSVIAALAHEHRVFLRMIDRIERTLSRTEAEGRAYARVDLLVFLTALERHEEIEAEAFADPPDSSDEGTSQAAAESSREHAEIDVLRDEIRGMLEESSGSWEHFSSRARELTARLRRHFEIEEQNIWPRYAHAAGRSRARALARRVDERVKRLERELELEREDAVDYLDGRR